MKEYCESESSVDILKNFVDKLNLSDEIEVLGEIDKIKSSITSSSTSSVQIKLRPLTTVEIYDSTTQE